MVTTEGGKVLLELLSLRPGLGETGRDEQDIPDPLSGKFLDRRENPRTPDYDRSEIDEVIGKVRDGGHRGNAAHLPGTWIDRVEPPREPQPLRMTDHVEKPMVLRGCPHHGNMIRGEEPPQSFVVRLHHGCHPHVDDDSYKDHPDTTTVKIKDLPPARSEVVSMALGHRPEMV
ncbi:MAG: hypothetical protein BWX71_01467 [Deltaproteobacteria bacterium ADurb.Bin072]|nr:MAG: hypothetical protein BWX71_01467 [Deltaproteobacteria bacterium ADurb.Bin072]